MSSIERTAFPRFPKNRKIKQAELNRLYSITHDELKMINSHANTDKSRLNIAVVIHVILGLIFHDIWVTKQYKSRNYGI